VRRPCKSSQMDLLNGPLKIQVLPMRPDALALLGVELDVLQRIRRCHISLSIALPRRESIQSENSSKYVQENVVFRIFVTPPAHEVSAYIDRGRCIPVMSIHQG